MTYCNRCLYPTSKPDLFIDAEGVCSACRNFEAREAVPWPEREEEFLQTIREGAHGDYDVLVPVSGGKDSHAQVLKCIGLGLKVLAVNARTCHLSSLGRRNLDNIRNLCDLIEVAPNAKVRARLNKFGLQTAGDISWPEHVAIFTQPVRVAVDMGIPFILWGENPQNEYGGPQSGRRELDRAWLEEFGGLLGLRVSDVHLAEPELAPYTYPDDPSGVTGLFLGYFFPWDGYENALLARQHGFQWSDKPVQAHGFRYENLDNYQTGIHDFYKFAKYGFGRATDICCNHIRRGRMTREDALNHVRRWDGKFPWSYLDKGLEEILAHIDMTRNEFMDCTEMFVNRSIFEGPVDGLKFVGQENHTHATAV